MKTPLQKFLCIIAPSVSIATHWEPCNVSGPISKECDGFDSSEDEDWAAWQSEVRATAIVGGEEITGSDYLGGTFERAGDLPEYSNPEISGYERDMTERALSELLTTIESMEDPFEWTCLQTIKDEIAVAISHLNAA